jgi:hypothetical protein
MLKKLLICAALVAGSATANAGPILLSQGFEVGADYTDWYVAYLGTAPAETGWFQGNTGIFDAQAGSADSYIAANYLGAAAGGNVDSWLITPLLAAVDGAARLTFATRTGGALPGDNLEILVNTVGSLLLTDFVSLGSIGSYPTDWTFFNFQYDGPAANVRFAFRYTVTDTANNGDYIGIDSVTVRSIPEPGTLALLAMGMLLTPLVLRRRRARA